MTANNQPHKYRCETCENTVCGLSNESLRKAEQIRILDVGRIRLMRCTTEIYGCASHSSATKAEQRIADVIAELERTLNHSKKNIYGFTSEEAGWVGGRESGIEEALALLREKGE